MTVTTTSMITTDTMDISDGQEHTPISNDHIPFLDTAQKVAIDHGRIIFTQSPAACLNARAWLPGTFMVPSNIWPMLERELPTKFWRSVSAWLSPQQHQTLLGIMKDNTNDKLALFMADNELPHISVRVTEHNNQVTLGELLYGYIDFILLNKKRSYLHARTERRSTKEIEARILDVETIRTMFHMHARIGHSFYVDGVDRARLATILQNAARRIEPYRSSQLFCEGVSSVTTMLIANSHDPVLLGHSHRNSTLDWCTAWQHNWKCTLDILNEHVPSIVENANIASLTSEQRECLAQTDYFHTFMKKIRNAAPIEHFDICVAMRRSFGYTLQLASSDDGFVFKVHTRLVDRTTLGSFCALTTAQQMHITTTSSSL